MMHYVESLILE